MGVDLADSAVLVDANALAPKGSHRLRTARGHRLRRGLTGMVLACSALLAVSCGSAERSANADETTNAPGVASEGPDVVLVDLDDAGEVATWTTVNDPVMGGMSTSSVTFGDGGLVFSGNISLENNGGSPRPAVRRTPISGARQQARSRSACALWATARPTC